MNWPEAFAFTACFLGPLALVAWIFYVRNAYEDDDEGDV